MNGLPKFHHPLLHEAAVEVGRSAQVAALTVGQIDADINGLTAYLRNQNVRIFVQVEISEGEMLAWAPQGELKIWDFFWFAPSVDKPVSLPYLPEDVRRRTAAHLPALVRALAKAIG